MLGDKKMTDNDIIKALEKILELMCREGDLQRASTISNALNLINRQKSEIDILIRKKEALRDEIAEQQAEIEEYRAKYKDLYTKLSNVQTMAITVNEQADEIKAEAYKEFAERLKLQFIADSLQEVINQVLTELTERKEDEECTVGYV